MRINGSFYSQVGLCDNGTINLFLNKHLLEALSLMRSISNGVVVIRKLDDMVAVSNNSSTMPGLNSNLTLTYTRKIEGMAWNFSP